MPQQTPSICKAERPVNDNFYQSASEQVLSMVYSHQPTLALAPMEGVSDATARALLTSLGGIDFCVTEFFRVTTRPVSPRIFRRDCPELDTGGRTPSGVPVLVQLLGSQLDAVAESAVIAKDLGAPGIDLNFGCPAKRVNGHDGGASLLKTPHRVEHLVAAVRKVLPQPYPVSAKIRLGWENSTEVIPIAQAAMNGGAAWVTIHGRTKIQMYQGNADWKQISRVVKALNIPIIANGDIVDQQSFDECRHVTDADNFMIGRGAFRKPNLFRFLKGLDPKPWNTYKNTQILLKFCDSMPTITHLRAPERATLCKLKQWVRYLAIDDLQMAACFQKLKRAQSLDVAISTLNETFC